MLIDNRLKLIILITVIITSLFILPANSRQQKNIFLLFSKPAQMNQEYFLDLSTLLKTNTEQYNFSAVNINKLTSEGLNKKINAIDSCVISIDQDSLEAVLAVRSQQAIFSTGVSQIELDNLFYQYQQFSTRFSGIYSGQSFKRQLFLAKVINHESKNVTVIFGRQSRYYLSEYKKTSEQLLFNLSFEILRQQEPVLQSFYRINPTGGFLMILNEAHIYSIQNLQSLLISSYKKQIPMIGSKKSDTKIAALASVYTPLNLLAKEAAEGVLDLCQKNKAMPLKYSQHYKVNINKEIAKHLNYSHLDEKKLQLEIARLEGQSIKRLQMEKANEK